MLKKTEYMVILYYKYIEIDHPEDFRNKHLLFCQNLNLLGRIIISHEGINGTLSGTKENIRKYISEMQKVKIFSDIDFKTDYNDQNAFKKLSIKIKKEIVNLNLTKDIPLKNLLKQKGKYLTPIDFHNKIKEKNTILIDARNDYEYKLGNFKTAINPKIKNFRDLPKWVQQNKNILKNKQILTYCTGGIRCEKFSAFLKKQGFTNVYQLKGGIINYGKEKSIKENLWQGKLYVFDNRIAIPINNKKSKIISKDHFDNTPCDRYINCANPSCNKQFFCHKNNELKFLGSCCDKCRFNKNNRFVAKNKKEQSYNKNV